MEELQNRTSKKRGVAEGRKPELGLKPFVHRVAFGLVESQRAENPNWD